MSGAQSVSKKQIPRAIATGLAVSLVITLAGTAIGAWMLCSEMVGETRIGYITVIVLLFSSAAGAGISTVIAKEKLLPIGMLTGGSYFLTLLAITSLFLGGSYSGVGECALVILAGVLSAALLSLKKQKRTKKNIRIP